MNEKRPNLVLIFTDTQACEMIGAYGHPECDTPNLDRLASEGVRFDRAYTSCPLCTPARGALLTGLHPQVCGSWANEMGVSSVFPMMGAIFSEVGYRTFYSGKWHLDGAGYQGNGEPGGGFEPDGWYDQFRYIEDIGEETYASLKGTHSPEEAEARGLIPENMWAHRVVDRAEGFLREVGEDPYLMVVAFDEPHGPFIRPAEYHNRLDPASMVRPPSYNAPLDGKPASQRRARSEMPCAEWDEYIRMRMPHFDCNAYVDREIGRLVDAVRAHDPDAIIVYTADHGDMLGCHGLLSKGPMMYDQTTRVPFIISGPESRASRGGVHPMPVSHVDVLPTLLDLAGEPVPESIHGRSLVPALLDPAQRINDAVLVSFNRFGIYHRSNMEFWPIRCLVTDKHKLAVNLFDRDELYDLESDPHELSNTIDENPQREALLDRLISEMERVSDPMRGDVWWRRPWATPRQCREFYPRPEIVSPGAGFPFDPNTRCRSGAGAR